MIELNSKTQQDFLNREWVQKLLDAGVDMSDAKYCIVSGEKGDYVALKSSWEGNVTPTYTVSELLYKLHEYIYPTVDDIKYAGGIQMTKDAPFYPVWYNLKAKNGNILWDYIYAEGEYPIESLASVLIQCHQKDIGIGRKDVGNISNK